jgi:hypothetical protein
LSEFVNVIDHADRPDAGVSEGRAVPRHPIEADRRGLLRPQPFAKVAWRCPAFVPGGRWAENVSPWSPYVPSR